MTLANSRIETLKKLIALEEKRVTIQGDLDSIDRHISAVRDSIITGGNATTSSVSAFSPKTRSAGRPPGSKNVVKTNGHQTKGRKRGAVGASIVEHLKAAGPAGIKIGDLAAKLGKKYQNVYIWFATTGKKNPNIKRIAPATYSFNS